MNKRIRKGDKDAAANVRASVENILKMIDEDKVDWQAWAKGDKHKTLITICLFQPDPIALAAAKLEKAQKEVKMAEEQLKEEQRQLAAASSDKE